MLSSQVQATVMLHLIAGSRRMNWTLDQLAGTLLRHAVVSVAAIIIVTAFLRWAARRRRDRNGGRRGPGEGALWLKRCLVASGLR